MKSLIRNYKQKLLEFLSDFVFLIVKLTTLVVLYISVNLFH